MARSPALAADARREQAHAACGGHRDHGARAGADFSRSGISALALALVVMGWLVVRRQQGRWRKLIAAGYLVLLGITLVASVGADALVRRFGEGTAVGGRLGIWADARDTARAASADGNRTEHLSICERWFTRRHDIDRLCHAAHNDYLQLAAEGGLLLTIPVAICVGVVHPRRAPAPPRGQGVRRLLGPRGRRDGAVGHRAAGDGRVQPADAG